MITFDAVRKQFGKLVAVNDVSFDIQPGKISGLIGPNGSGKTTTFNLATGFLRPTSGKVRLNGKDISGLKPHQIARQGLVRTFQLTSLFPDMTARQAVETALEGGGLNRDPFRLPFLGANPSSADCNEVLKLMDLERFRDTPAKFIPSGLQRTLSIATALILRPSTLILDEPLAGLNPTEKAELVERIAMLNRHGMTIFIVEHDIRSVMSLCSHIVVMNFGSKIAEGSPAEIRADSKVVSAYLGQGGAGA